MYVMSSVHVPVCAPPHSVTFYSESQILRWRDRLLEVLGAPRRVKDSFAFVHRAEAVDRGFLGRRDGGREESEGTHNGLAGRDRPGAVKVYLVAECYSDVAVLCCVYVTDLPFLSSTCHLCH